MRESVDLKKIKGMTPAGAEGNVCIDFRDPLTGRIKERIEGKNHVFTESLFSGENYDWISTTSNAWCVLNDSTIAINTNFPYVLGQTVGYGRPSYGTSGTYRGAYNASNQKLASITMNSVSWKFQYDFTTAQANGTPMGTVGLTHQYSSFSKQYITGFRVSNYSSSFSRNTSDGRYSYSCSTAGIITKYDNWLGASSTIDVSAIVGTTSSSYKTVGYAPATNKYYIYVYSSTSSLRKMYVYSDNTFSTLENTYSCSNVAFGSNSCPIYVYGNNAYYFNSNSTIYKADFVNNTAYTTITISSYNYAQYTENTNASSGDFSYQTIGYNDYVIVLGGGGTNMSKGIIYNLSTDRLIGYVSPPDTYGYNTCFHPISTEKLACTTSSGRFCHNAAITSYLLSNPVTKTSSNAMTVTYELEVFWG